MVSRETLKSTDPLHQYKWPLSLTSVWRTRDAYNTGPDEKQHDENYVFQYHYQPLYLFLYNIRITLYNRYPIYMYIIYLITNRSMVGESAQFDTIRRDDHMYRRSYQIRNSKNVRICIWTKIINFLICYNNWIQINIMTIQFYTRPPQGISCYKSNSVENTHTLYCIFYRFCNVKLRPLCIF